MSFVTKAHTKQYKDLEVGDEFRSSDIVQTEMVKIAILKQSILRINFADDVSNALSVEVVREDLHRWHQDLPDLMRLTNLVNSPDMTPEARVSIYTVHLLYLGAIMLIYRQILNRPQQSANNREKNLDQAHIEAITAAQQSSRILNLLRQDNGVHRRCWLSIFQSYCAGVLILHGIAQNLTRMSDQKSSIMDDLQEAGRCLDILSYCGEVDAVAAQFCALLRPYYDTLRSIAVASRGPASTDGSLDTICAGIFDLVRRPFGQPGDHSTVVGSSIGRGPCPTSTSTVMPSMEISRAQPTHQGQTSGPPGISVIDLKPDNFLSESKPHGWIEHTKTH